MAEAVIAAATRSPIGRAKKGSLRDVRGDDLAARVARSALDQVPQLHDRDIDDLLLGCAQPAGEQGYGLARMVAMGLGNENLPGVTVQRYCASSLQTTRMAAHAIRAGEGEIFLSAGVEAVSRYSAGKADGMPDTHNPRYESGKRRTEAAFAASDLAWTDPTASGEQTDPYIAMGHTAEYVAAHRKVSRADQDAFAALSQNRAVAALDAGTFDWEITPITLPDGTVVSTDDGPRRGVTAETLSGLKPVFHPEGTVTAGNCCPLNDGAAAVVVMADHRAAELGITPLARIVSTGVSALTPELMGLGPVEASRQALRNAGMTINDIDLVEINEAFAAQVLPCLDDLGVSHDAANVHGGAIALGHPFGMTGARMTTTLINALRTRDAQFGLETMCTAGGQGMAMVIERLS